MSNQEQIAITNPAFTQGSVGAAIHRIKKKDQEKQEEILAHLGAILKLVEEELVQAKSGIKGRKDRDTEASATSDKILPFSLEETPSEGGPSGTGFEDAMAAMALALQLLQVEIVKFSEDKAQYDNKISEGLVATAKKTLKDFEHKLKKIAKEERKHKRANFWEKFSEAVVGAITLVAGAILVQPELVAMGVLSFMSAAGAFEYATKVLAHLLAESMPMKDAEIVAAVLICAITIAVCMAAADPEEGVEEGAEASLEIEEAATTASENTLEIEEDVEEQITSFKEMLEAIKNSPPGQLASKIAKYAARFNKFIGSTGRLAIMGTMSSFQSTELVTRIADAIMVDEKYSKKKREEIEQRLGYALAAVTFLASFLVAGGAAAGGTRAAARSASISYRLAKTISLAQRTLFTLGGLGQEIMGIYEGSILLQQGKLEKAFAGISAHLEMLSTQLQMSSTQTSEDQRYEADTLKSQRVGNRSLMELMRGEAAFANLFTAYSPV